MDRLTAQAVVSFGVVLGSFAVILLLKPDETTTGGLFALVGMIVTYWLPSPNQQGGDK